MSAPSSGLRCKQRDQQTPNVNLATPCLAEDLPEVDAVVISVRHSPSYLDVRPHGAPANVSLNSTTTMTSEASPILSSCKVRIY